MLLGTFQPNPNREKTPQHRLDSYRVFADALNGEQPVFCFAASNLAEFCFGAWVSTPYWPDKLMLVDTEDCVAYDAFEWNQLVKHEKQDTASSALLEGVDPLFAEYVISKSALEKGLVAQVGVLEELACPAEGDALAATDGGAAFDCRRAVYLTAAKDYSRAVTELRTSSEWLRLALAKEKFTQYVAKFFYLDATDQSVSTCEQLALPLDIKSKVFQTAQALRQDIDINDVTASREDYRKMVRLFGEQYLESCRRFWESCYERPHSVSRRLGRNDPCPCGSGKKYKKCCGGLHAVDIKGMQITH